MERFSNFNTTDDPIQLPPGFRFHPTDEELITHYLSPKVLDSNFTTKAIGEVDLNKVEPWDLPWKAKMGEKEWYFFCMRDRKYPTGLRTNRATDAGYWKATGKDKEIFRAKILIGMKKTLVFYRGRAPRGEKTNWVMHEYRLEGKNNILNLHKTVKNEWVICRIFKKSSGGKKVHISGLARNQDYLPPLLDLCCDENQTRTAAAAEGSDHVTCFSNPMDDLKSVDEFSSSSKNTDSPMMIPFDCPKVSNVLSENLHYSDSVLMQDQSLMRLLLKQEFSSDIGISSHEVGFRPFDDQEFPIVSTCQADFDCLWNY